MSKKDEHREPIKRREKIDLNPAMSDTIRGLIERYDVVDRHRTEEMQKDEREQNIERIKTQTEILKRLDETLSGKGYDVQKEVNKLRERKVH